MKQVDIRSIIIPNRPRSGNYPTGTTVTPGGGGSNATIDLSKYMKLALWLENFEAKTDTDGNQYIYAKKPLVSVGGFIAYCSDEAHVPSIFEGIPIDNDTIYWDESTGVRILKAKGSGGGSDFDATAMWTALSSTTNEQINKSHLTTALSGYAIKSELNTSNWDTAYSWGNHANAGYAKQTALDDVSTKLNDFLEGSDTDTIINKWKELEAFLAGMSETDNLAEILSTKADKSYVDTELTKYVTLATEQTIDGLKHFTNGLTIGATKHKIYEKDGNILIEGNVLVTGGITAYSDGSSSGGSGGGGIDVEVLWEILGGTGTQQINVTHLTNALSGYATESWVTSQNYLTSVNWSQILNKPTTLGGYDIIDAYTRTESDNRFVNVSGDTMTGDLSTKRLTSTDLFIDTGDATLKIYSGYNPNVGYSDGNICFQTSFDRTDGQNHEYPTSYPSRCNILLQPRGGQVYIGINPNEGDPHYKLFVNGRIYSTVGFIKENSSDSYLLLGGGGHKAISDFMTRKDGAAPNNGDYGFGYWDGIGSYISFAASGWGGQLRAQGNTLYYRYISNGKPNAWQILAKITDNVASATKLQTARTIWGQSFDGTANVVNPAKMQYLYFIATGGNIAGYIGRSSSSDNRIFLSSYLNTDIILDTGGNVGIGISTPSYKLDVNGDIHASDWLRTTGNVGWYSQTYGGGIYMEDAYWVRVYGGKSFYCSDQISASSLNIRGDERSDITTSYRANGSITNIGEPAAGIRHSFNFAWYDSEWYIGNIRSGSTASLGFGVANGNKCYLRVNTDTTTVYGNILATGGITCYSSDQRAKTVIEQINLSLKQIANAPTIRFKWNNWKIKDDGKTHIGGIAQYMQQLLPETVLEADGMLNMDYATTGYIFETLS